MFKKKLYKMLWSSDQHILHPNTPTRHILNNLSTFFYKDNNLKEVDLIVFGGDFFHDLSVAPDTNMLLAQRWIENLLYNCLINDIIVIVLEGTYSHDRGQPECFDILKPRGLDLRYVNCLKIEYIEKFDMNFLLIPDNFGFLPKDDIYEDALKLLASHNLKQADIVFLHGALDVQLPPMANKDNSLYDSSKWLGLAKLGMFGGHVHKPFTYKDKFWSSGSFDRTAHGEMHPKGAYEVLFNKEKLIPNFYENKNALIYDVIDINVKTTREKLIETLNKYLAKRPMDNSHIRIRGGSSAITSSIINDYKERFPQYNFDLENEKEDNIEIDDTLYTLDMYKGTSLDKNNIESNLFKFMESTLELNPDIEKDLLSNLLNEVMDE